MECTLYVLLEQIFIHKKENRYSQNTQLHSGKFKAVLDNVPALDGKTHFIQQNWDQSKEVMMQPPLLWRKLLVAQWLRGKRSETQAASFGITFPYDKAITHILTFLWGKKKSLCGKTLRCLQAGLIFNKTRPVFNNFNKIRPVWTQNTLGPGRQRSFLSSLILLPPIANECVWSPPAGPAFSGLRVNRSILGTGMFMFLLLLFTAVSIVLSFSPQRTSKT